MQSLCQWNISITPCLGKLTNKKNKICWDGFITKLKRINKGMIIYIRKMIEVASIEYVIEKNGIEKLRHA